MPNSDLNERRDERVPIEASVRISTIDPEIDSSTGKPYFRTSQETCADISRGGTFVKTRDPIARGRRLLLELEIPDGPAIQTMGRVAWTRTAIDQAGEVTSSGFGIEFMGGPPEQLSKLRAFLDNAHREERPVPEQDLGWQAPKPSRPNQPSQPNLPISPVRKHGA